MTRLEGIDWHDTAHLAAAGTFPAVMARLEH